MKPLIVFSDVTVDGFMTGPDNDLDFMVHAPGGPMFSSVVERRALTLRSARSFPSRTVGVIYSTT